MCGICGILATSDGFALDEGLITRMHEVIAHRGPDHGGSWIDPQRRGDSNWVVRSPPGPAPDSMKHLF